MQLLFIWLMVVITVISHSPPLQHKYLPPLSLDASCQNQKKLYSEEVLPNSETQAQKHSVSSNAKQDKILLSSDQQFHDAKKLDDGLTLQAIKKCRAISNRQKEQGKPGANDQQQFCYVRRQEFISKEQIIGSLQNKHKGDDLEGDQYVWVALVCAGMMGAYLFYKMKVGLLLDVLAQVELKADTKSTQYEKRLQELNQLKKIYQVYWDRVVYRNEVDVCYEHTVYEGRFLTQETYVYAVKLEHADVGTLEHKLGKLLNCSHRRLAKLYYYTKTSEMMLIFTQKISPLSLKDLKQHFSTQTTLSAKKNSIIDIIQTLQYLEEKIQLKLLPLQSIQLDIVASNEYRPNSDCYDYKINTIPCLFRKMHYHCSDEDFDTASEDAPICLVRLNIVSLFHLILLNGKLFDKQEFNRLAKQSHYSHEDYIQFLDFILYQAKSIGHTHQLLFRQVLEHPFLWDSKRKILFLADFSNYMETHLDDYRLSRLEKHAKEYRIIKANWIKQFHSIFASEVNFYRKYDFQSIRDLIRMIRNKLNHFHEIPKEVKSHIGKTPEGFIEYCFNIFPKLLPFAYIYTRKKKWKLHMK